MTNNISNKMKNNFNKSCFIKQELIRNGIWNAKNVSESLKSAPGIHNIRHSDTCDCILLDLDKKYMYSNNTLSLDSYDRISNSISSIFKSNENKVCEVLSKDEYKSLTKDNTILNSLYDITKSGNNSLIIHI